MNWRWFRYRDLTLDDLYDALQLRCRVFILEQGAYLDPDGLDRSAWHLLGRDDAGKLQASAAALKDRCRAGKGGVEAALFDVHEAFHRLIEAGSGA